MIEAFWIPLLPPYLIGLVLSFLVEAMLTPRPVAPWRRPLAAVGVHVGVWTFAFALELMLFRRPYFAVANVLAIELVIVLVSNAKYQALREPFVYPDFEYFMDAIRHPRLYLPFFGMPKALAAGGGYGLVLWMGLTLEESVATDAGFWWVSFAELPQEGELDPAAPLTVLLAASLGLGIVGLLGAILGGSRIGATFDAASDLRRVGLIATLWSYGRSEREPTETLAERAPFLAATPPSAGGCPDPLPDMIVIQSESFFDARRQFPLMRNDVLRNFDQLRAEAWQHGLLKVDAWGANTVRTEFGFLSGMQAEDLGVHRYNPYRRLAMGGFPTLATYLRSLGYRTICIHPYYPSFYKRDKVLPQLGFDEFISLSAFAGAPHEGAYVSDCAVGARVAQLLAERSDQPLYLHVITMENHGPLHCEDVRERDTKAILSGPMPNGAEDLVAYGRHLRNADVMLGTLREALMARSWPASLCLFGDHVPIMPSVYRALGEPDGRTDYLLWATGVPGGGHVEEYSIDSLALAYLSVSGLSPRRRNSAKSHTPTMSDALD